MQVKELLEYLNDKNPKAKVVVRGVDHSYREAYATIEIAEYHGQNLVEADGTAAPVGVIVIE